jgi:hypothetical protein
LNSVVFKRQIFGEHQTNNKPFTLCTCFPVSISDLNLPLSVRSKNSY